ncbi:hypothetical protein B0H34DRAFT_684741 [Crassisporium funariophilum]|nr:hypothetical protein B0H34DRAFT_684741 [Crassisporium funariophilum]
MRFSTTLITIAALALGNTVAAYEEGTTSIDAREYNNDIEARDDHGTLQTRDFGELDTRELDEILEVVARLVEDYELSTRDVESDHQLYTRAKGAQPKRAGGGGGGKGRGVNTHVNVDPGSILHGAGTLVGALHTPRDVESDHQLYARKGAQPKRGGGGGGGKGRGANTRVNIDPGSILHGAGTLANALHGGA